MGYYAACSEAAFTYRPSRAFGAAIQLAVIGEGAGVEASGAVALAMTFVL